jgi:hypothetical protein
VDDADDFDRIGEDLVKDEIIVADEIAEIARDVRSRMAEMGWSARRLIRASSMSSRRSAEDGLSSAMYSQMAMRSWRAW